jgi:hypothetical protein
MTTGVDNEADEAVSGIFSGNGTCVAQGKGTQRGGAADFEKFGRKLFSRCAGLFFLQWP